MAWKQTLDCMYDEEESDTVRGIEDGRIDSRHGEYKLCSIHRTNN